MLTQGADEILRQCIALVNISADLANEAFLALSFGFWLNIALIISVAHRFLIGNNSCLGNGADEHTVGIKVNVLLHL